ncbi:hypothetical protein SKAU_G00275040 [Synaphobranchus kaupii]|uniref:Uncharacterized protein n=1 Tax=Synaphobranchus kaupii TaxID=118154 RepID=A0A9Q1IQ30_SYNKA|nr:hypothetical protein SKAU_G00275040 [Synaphobranchus kaupii]
MASGEMPSLSIRHGVRVVPPEAKITVEDVLLAAGDQERMQGFAADSAGHPEADAGEVGSEQAQRTEAQGCQDGVGTRRRMGRVRAGPCRQTLRLARKRLCQSSLLQLRAG